MCQGLWCGGGLSLHELGISDGSVPPMRPLPKILIIGTALSATLSATMLACNASAHTTSAHSAASINGVHGYLFTSPAEVEYLQWQGDSGAVTATLNVSNATDEPPNAKVERINTSPTVTVHDGTIAITVGSALLGTATSYGTVKNHHLIINGPRPDGSIAATSWREASPSDYNTALATLNATVSEANANAQIQVDDAARAKRISSAETAVWNATAALNSTVDTSRRSPDSLSASSTAVDASTALTLSEARTVAQQQANGSDAAQRCRDAAQVARDAAQVGRDAAQVGRDTQTVLRAITSARDASASLTTVLAALLNVEPGYSGNPNPQGLAALQQTASTTINTAISAANKAIDHANAQVTIAYNAAHKLSTADCVIDDQQDTPEEHIS